ncbi:MAG: hypothetical protein JW827_04155 [Spirochaetes bacterium]|nr:hypothetical protein [Spirochaetota bacterium]
MFILIVSVAINLFILYYAYKKITLKMESPQEKNLSEINSLMVEFNKLTKNNVDLIEEKIDELGKAIRIADEKLNRMREQINDIPLNEASIVKNLKEVSRDLVTLNEMKNRTQDKYKSIKQYLKKNKNPSQIAELLGISRGEVDLYINLIKENKVK